MSRESEKVPGSSTYDIHIEIEVKAPPTKVYEAWLDSGTHTEMLGRPVRISSQVGATFDRGGVHTGVIVELVPGKRIVEASSHSSFLQGDYSLVTLTFEPQGEYTKIILDHKGIPLYFRGHMEKGWGEFYLPKVQAYFARK